MTEVVDLLGLEALVDLVARVALLLVLLADDDDARHGRPARRHRYRPLVAVLFLSKHENLSMVFLYLNTVSSVV